MARRIETCEGGGYIDTQTGEPLGPERAAYEVYLQRLCERHRVGEQADRLVRIVDQYLPKVADENRAYVMRYPHKVNAMLRRAWALCRRIRTKRKRKRGKESRRSDAEAVTPTEPRAPEQTERLQDVRGNMGAHVTRATSASEDTPPDWGGEEEDSSPDGQEKEQAAGTQWPWGPAGRPSDQDAGQQRPNEPAGEPPRKRSGLPTDKPNEPAGEPPDRPLRLASTSEGEPQTAEGKSIVTLVPNLRWQVPRVQEHMARQRGSTTWSRSETQ